MKKVIINMFLITLLIILMKNHYNIGEYMDSKKEVENNDISWSELFDLTVKKIMPS